MQINGMNNFLSQFAVRSNNAGQMSYVSPLLSQGSGDTLLISEAASRLRFHSENTAKLRESSAAKSDPVLQLMDKSIKEVKSILKEMKALTVTAQSETLTTLDRMEMQIKMEDLRKDLREAMGKSHRKLADRLGLDGEGPLSLALMGEGSLISMSPALPGEDTRGVLQRARDRIAKGEAWDTSECYEIVNELQAIRVGDEEIQVEMGQPISINTEAVMKVGDRLRGGWVVQEKENVPTVRQKLEASNTIILMDSKSATKGVERLNAEINNIDQLYEKFTRFAKNYKPESSGEADTNILKTPKGSMFQQIKRAFKGVLNGVAEGIVSEAGPEVQTWNKQENDPRFPSSVTDIFGVTETPSTKTSQTEPEVNPAVSEILAQMGFNGDYHVNNEKYYVSSDGFVSGIINLTTRDLPNGVLDWIHLEIRVAPHGPNSQEVFPVEITPEDPEFSSSPLPCPLKLEGNVLNSLTTLQVNGLEIAVDLRYSYWDGRTVFPSDAHSLGISHSELASRFAYMYGGYNAFA